jgi:hypothetical protein
MRHAVPTTKWGEGKKEVARFLNPFYLRHSNAPIAQLDRASDYESEGRAFESLWVHHFPFARKSGI